MAGAGQAKEQNPYGALTGDSFHLINMQNMYFSLNLQTWKPAIARDSNHSFILLDNCNMSDLSVFQPAGPVGFGVSPELDPGDQTCFACFSII